LHIHRFNLSQFLHNVKGSRFKKAILVLVLLARARTMCRASTRFALTITKKCIVIQKRL